MFPSPVDSDRSQHHTAVTRRQALTWDFKRPTLDSDFWIRIQRHAMACRFEVLLSGEDARYVAAAGAALDLVERLEAQLTVFRSASEVVHLNQRAACGATPASPELLALLRHCRELHEKTSGAFDVTSTPLSRCWGFLRREGRLPSDAEIAAARAVVGMQHVDFDEELRTVHFRRDGVELNFGSIGKGFALDQMAPLLRRCGVARALLSAGRSSVLAIGGDEGGFLVDVVSPQAPSGRLTRLRLRDAALGTSGAGVQFMEVDGKRYGHVLDPRTGWPASGVLSASVVASGAATADALSTAFLVGGLPLAEDFCAKNSGVLALVTPDDGSERPCVVGSHPGAALVEQA